MSGEGTAGGAGGAPDGGETLTPPAETTTTTAATPRSVPTVPADPSQPVVIQLATVTMDVVVPSASSTGIMGGMAALVVLAVFVAAGGAYAFRKSLQKKESDENKCDDIKSLLEQRKRELEEMVKGWPEEKLKEVATKRAMTELEKNEVSAPAMRAARKTKEAYDNLQKKIELLQKKYDLCMLSLPLAGKTRKRVFVIHGWDGTPDTGWFPWLKKELEARGFEVRMPQMPEAGAPRIKNWIPAIARSVGTPDEDTYFVGHSMGCGAIIRYIESLPEGQKVGGAVFIAGFFRPLTGLTKEEEEVDREWHETPLNPEKVRSRMKKSFALFSDNDPWVPVENAEDFRNRLGSEVLIRHDQSHFNEGAGFKELPIALEKLLEISS